MRLLLAAAACSPTGGSEGGVGWAAFELLARRHQVRVLTRASLREEWDEARRQGQVPEGTEVRFIGTDAPWHSNRMLARLQSWQRYFEFNREILGAATEWHQEDPFDLVHQVTYATWRVPSPLWRLDVPFVWGPLGGSGTIPRPFRSMLSRQARALEEVRDFQSAWARRSPALLRCIREAAVVIAANREAEELLQELRGERPLLRLPVAYLTQDTVERFRRNPGPVHRGPLRIFAGGNIEGRKGVSLAIRALARVAAAGHDFHYTVAGGGPEVGKLSRLAEHLGLGRKVEFHPGFRGEHYVRRLQESDVYLLPSFRETLGMTMQEAVLAGCYPIVVDASAPGEVVRMAGGSAVAGATQEEVIDGLANALIRVAEDREWMGKVATEASQRVAEFFSDTNYQNVVEEAYRMALAFAGDPRGESQPRDR